MNIDLYSMYSMYNVTFLTSPPYLYYSQITDIRRMETSVPPAARSIDCVDILGLAQFVRTTCSAWMWYGHVVAHRTQTGRTSGKCRFVRRFMLCAVHKMSLRFPREGKGMGRACNIYGGGEVYTVSW